MKKSLLTTCITILCSIVLFAQKVPDYKADRLYKNWVKLAPAFKEEFYQTEEAVRIADNVLLYQQTTGGWPKNIFIPKELTGEEKAKVIADKTNVNESTIDNGATSTEITYLAKVYNATGDQRYKKAVAEGLQYLFNAQYGNGGWPQFWPRPKGYYTEITYNDNAMVNVMKLLQQVYEKQKPYTFIPDSVCAKARQAFDNGITCILNTQVRQNEKLTVWCAQYDAQTLKPAKARAYELVSLSGAESDNIVLLLMSVKNPSIEIRNALEGVIKWFEKVKIEGYKLESFINEEGKNDCKVVACTNCLPMWARFYDIDTNQPFFCDRDGIKRYNLSEIGYERRNGYSWYNNDGVKVFKQYEKWKKENGTDQ